MAPTTPKFAHVLLAAASVSLVAAKIHRVQFTLGEQQHWKYIGKFGYGVGDGEYTMKLRRTDTDTGNNIGVLLDVEMYLDEDWDRTDSEPTLCSRRDLARNLERVTASATDTVVGGIISQHIRSHVWYWAVSDCHGVINGTASFEAEIAFRQEGGSHFSVELQWMPRANAAALIFSGVFLLVFGRKSWAYMKSTGSLHPVIWILACACAMQYLSQGLHAGHLAIYKSNGEGSVLLELLSEIFFHLCQVVQTSLFVAIGNGYTLSRAAIGSRDSAVLMCIFTGVAHVFLVFLSKSGADDANRHTDHDGISGWTFFLLRCGLYAWFMWTAGCTGKSSGMKLKSFLNMFKIVASMYLLAYPAMFLITRLFAPYLREPVIESGLMLSQTVSSIGLASMFLERGDYFKISSLSASLLPGGCSHSWKME